MPTNLSFAGTPTYAAGKFGRALSLASADSRATAGKVPASGTFAIECWFQTVGGGGGVILGQSGAFYFFVTGGQLRGVYGSGSGETALNSNVTVNDNGWHHAALQIGATGGSLYLDGARVATSTTSAADAGVDRAANFVTIGSLNGGFPFGGLVEEIAIYTAAPYSGANYTVPTAATPNNASGIDRLYHLDDNGTDSAGAVATKRIAPNDAAIVYSPGNWTPATADVAKAHNAGAYLRFGFTGSTCILNLDVSRMAAGRLSRIGYRLDGQGGWTVVDAAANIQVAIPAGLTSRPRHLLEVVLDATSQAVDRWSATSATALVLTGITVEDTATVAAPAKRSRSGLIIGDSITETVLGGLRDGAAEVAQNSALAGWALRVGDLLGAEIGVIGCGSQGYTKGGAGNTPALPDSYSLVMEGVARSFSPAPDIIVCNMGANDGGASSATRQAACQLFLTRLLTSLGGAATTRVVILGTLGGTAQDNDFQAAVAAVNDPRVTYVSSAGVYDATFAARDLHPDGAANHGQIANRLADKLLPYAQPRRFNVALAA